MTDQMVEVAKAQWVRLWDVFGLTPLMRMQT